MRLRRALSLHARQLLAASLGLLAFLGLTGLALDRAFQATVLSNVNERMRSYAFGYLGDIDFDRAGQFLSPDGPPPDPRFSQPGSGLYASVAGEGMQWQSASSLGRSLPPPEAGAPGEFRFEGPLDLPQHDGRLMRVYRMSQTTIWETPGGDVTLTLAIHEDEAGARLQMQVFRKSMWAYLGLAGLLLLAVQTLALRWSLQPLRHLERDIGRVQRGESQRLSGRHPRELEPITDSLNAFIEGERSHLEQSRNTLSDLAHSLKTPLAVLRARLDADASHQQLREEVQAQVQRMNDLVSYQLARAARSGHALFSAPIEIEPRAEEIVAGLEKVYAGKGVVCEFDIDPGARFNGELGDLQELIGNLLENAFKWAGSRVLLTVKPLPGALARRAGVAFAIEDDGPGIAPGNVEHLLQRGVRGDERVQGHGIGLAIVQDIVRAYRGELKVGRSTELGGARFEVSIPPVI